MVSQFQRKKKKFSNLKDRNGADWLAGNGMLHIWTMVFITGTQNCQNAWNLTFNMNHNKTDLKQQNVNSYIRTVLISEILYNNPTFYK